MTTPVKSARKFFCIETLPPKEDSESSSSSSVTKSLESATTSAASILKKKEDSESSSSSSVTKSVENATTSSPIKRPRLTPESSGSSSSGVPFAPPSLLQQLVQVGPEAPSIFPLPDLFSSSSNSRGTHSQLLRARGALVPKPVPDTPARPLRADVRRNYESVPLVRNAIETSALIQTKLEEIENETFKPFDLEVAPGIIETIDHIEFLSDKGRNSEVYLCEVRGKGKWVLKLIKPNLLRDSPQSAIEHAANQLCRYGQNLEHPILKDHIVQHANFDPHLEATKGFLKLEGSDRYPKFKAYVTKNVHQGFLFAKFIPNEFDLTFDKTASRWIQVKTILSEGVNAGICNDARADNMRTVTLSDGTEKVFLIDLFEKDGDEDEPICYVKEFLETFTDVEEEKEWLYPLPKSNADEFTFQGKIW